MATIKYLKLASDGEPNQVTPSPARAKLAEAIANVREAEKNVADNSKRIAALHVRECGLEEALDAASVAVEKAQQERISAAADPIMMPAAMVKQAREAAEEAEESLAVCRTARKMAEDERRLFDDSVSYARARLQTRISDVLKRDSAVRRLCEKFETLSREHETLRQVLDLIRVAGALPGEFRFILAQRDWGTMPGAQAWKTALAQLEKDHNAALPEF